MKRATSCGAICTRAAARRLSRPAKRRSSLKSPRFGDTTTASIPAAFALSINVAIAPAPAGPLVRAMHGPRNVSGQRMAARVVDARGAAIAMRLGTEACREREDDDT